MDLFKKYINVILLVFAVFSANISFASSNPQVPVSDCGVSSGVVKAFEGEICEQDLSFRMMYKLFPTIIENFVFPIINPQYLELVPQLEEQNLHVYQSQEIIFFEIFKATNKISFFIIGVFVMWHFLFLGVIRSANDGSFLGKSWNTSSVLTKYGILIVLLLPISDTGVLVIHVVLLSILIMGIYFANYFWGIYLNYLQVGEDAMDISTVESSVVEQKSTQEEKFLKQVDLWDHNYFFAFSYAKELSLISLCKARTEKLLVLGALPFLTESNVSDLNTCLVNETEGTSWNDNSINATGTRGFSHYSNEIKAYNLTKNKGTFFTTAGIEFGNKDFQQCNSPSNNAFSSFDYNCGNIKVSAPSLPEGNIKLAIGASNFYEQYVTASTALMTTDDPTISIESAWQNVSNTIDTLFSDNGVLNAFKHNQGMIKKNVSFYFHTFLMNDALVGNSNYTENTTITLDSSSLGLGGMGYGLGSISFDSTKDYTATGNFNLLLSSYMKDARKVSKSIERFGCLKRNDLYSAATKAKKLIESYKNASPEDVSDYNTSCLDVETLEEIGINPKLYAHEDETGQILDDKITKELNISIEEGVQALQDLAIRIKNKRSAVERSFYKSVVNAPSNSLANRLRKEGWAVSGGYMLKLLSEKEMDNKLRHALQNSTVANAAKVNENGLPNLDLKAIIKTEDDSELKEWFDLSEGINKVVQSSVVKPARKDLKYVDVGSYINDNILSSMDSADFDASGQADLFDLLIRADLIKNLKAVVGIGEDGDLSMEQISVCISPEDNVELECPINLTNPIVEISKLGHNLINISTKIISAAIMLAMIEIAVMKRMKSTAGKENKGEVKGTNKKTEKAEDTDSKVKDASKQDKKAAKNVKKSKTSKFFRFLEKFTAFLHYFLKLLMTLAMFLLMVGFTLAYVIPLIPFIAFTIAFLSWVVISLEILVIAPIWLSFLFRMEDTNKPSTELYMAGFNFLMQMLFRPSLIVIAITIGWSLFAVIFMAINFTMATFMTSFSDSGFFVSFVYGLLLLIAYTLVVYVAIKQIFDLMIMLPNKIFTKVGVQPLDSSYEGNAKNTLSNFTMAGIGGSGLLASGINKSLTKNMQNRQKFKKAQKSKIANFNKSQSEKDEAEKAAKIAEKGKLNNE